MNRSELLLGQLFFYDSFGIQVKVYVGDSSNEQHKNLIRKGLAQLKNIEIKFIDYPASIMQVEVIINLINEVQEEFITVSGDDDYHILSHALKSIAFLKKNPEYVTCTGSVALMTTELKNGERIIQDISDYSPQKSLVSENPIKRMKLLADNYYLPLFCISRTENFKEAFKSNERIKTNIFWAETLPAFKLITMGNQHVLEGLAMVRGVHDQRLTYYNSFKDTFLNKTWTDSLHITIESILTHLKESKKIEINDETRTEIYQIFADYYLAFIHRDFNLDSNKPIRSKLPTSIKKILKPIYYRMNNHRINSGAKYPYSAFYIYFSSLKTALLEAQKIVN